MKLTSFAATIWLAILISGIVICLFGLITYSAHWFKLVNIDLFINMFAPDTYTYQALVIIISLALSILIFTVAIFVNYSIILVPISLALQIVGVALALHIGFMTTKKGKTHYYYRALFNFVEFNGESFEKVNGCKGIRLSGCQSDDCCDDLLNSAFDKIFDTDWRWFFWLPVVWLILMSLLLPSLLFYWKVNKTSSQSSGPR